MEENNNTTPIKQENRESNKSNVNNRQLLKYQKLSTTSMILGIVSIVTVCMSYVSIICGTLGIVFGAISLKNGKKNFSKTGIILGSLGIVLSMILLVVIVSYSVNFFMDLLRTIARFG